MITTLQPGIHDGIPAAVYHADPAPSPSLSSSVAVDLLDRSPAYVKHTHPRLNALRHSCEETPEMAFGSVVHELALGSGGGFSVWDGESWRGNDAKRFFEEATASGKTPIKQADFTRANVAVAAMREQLERMGLGYVLTEGKSEQVAIWQDRGHYMRAMFDRWLPARNEIWDIKTVSRSAHPDQIARTIASMKYHMRAEFYMMGASKITGIPAMRGGIGFGFLFLETEPPYCVTPCHLDDIFRAHGRRLANEAIDTWARCMESGEWPGYVGAPVELAAPGWMEFETDETIITSVGTKIV